MLSHRKRPRGARLTSWLFVALSGAATAACTLIASLDDHASGTASPAAVEGGTTGEGGAADGSHGDADPNAPGIEVTPPTLEAYPDSTSKVHLVVRGGLRGLGGDVNVVITPAAVDGGAPSVTATTPLRLMKDHAEADVDITASKSARHGSYALEIAATGTFADGSPLALRQTYPVTLVGHPGDVDTSLGTTDGIVDFCPTGFTTCNATDMVMDVDGTFVVVGTAVPTSSNFPVLLAARLRADGTLDQSFGQGGMATQTLGGYVQVPGIARLPDGTFAVGFQGNPNGGRLMLAHLAANGNLAPFNNMADGIQTDMSSLGPRAAVILVDDAGIAAAGGPTNGASQARIEHFALDGQPGPAVSTTVYSLGTTSTISAMMQTPQGIVFGGSSTTSFLDGGATHSGFVARAPAAGGAVDTTFGTAPNGGIALQSGNGSDFEFVFALAPHGTGVLAASFAQNAFDPNSSSLMRIFRLTGSGVLDNQFAQAGVLRPDAGGPAAPTALATLQDQSFLVCNGGAHEFSILHFDSAGLPAATAPLIHGLQGVARAIIPVDNERKLFVAGASQFSASPSSKVRFVRFWLH